MECIPSIDIRGGQAVRLLRGEFANETVFGDPLDQAEAFVDAGARRLHVVDLDAARTGEPVNRRAVLELIARAGVPVQVGGGVRTVESATALLEGGADRVVVGTAVVEHPAVVAGLVERYPGSVLVGLDHRRVCVAGRQVRELAVRGWEESSGVELSTVLGTLELLPLAGVIVTDISRDGTLSGPDLEGLSYTLGRTALSVYASGGVGSLADLSALAALESAGRRLAGAIVGRAFSSGAITIREAVLACEP